MREPEFIFKGVSTHNATMFLFPLNYLVRDLSLRSLTSKTFQMFGRKNYSGLNYHWWVQFKPFWLLNMIQVLLNRSVLMIELMLLHAKQIISIHNIIRYQNISAF